MPPQARPEHRCLRTADGGNVTWGQGQTPIKEVLQLMLVSYDWNCPQYITPRFTEAEIETHTAPLKARIAELEAQAAGRRG